MSMMIMIGHSSGANFWENVWGHGKGKKENLGIPMGHIITYFVNATLKNRVLVEGLQFVILPIK